MKYNLNEAAPAERDFIGNYELIPDDTEVDLIISIKRSRPGADNYDASTDGLCTYSNDGGSKMLVLECTVIGGPYDKKKSWERWYIEGPSDQAIEITRTKMRAVVEGALGISPTDKSPAAVKRREEFDIEKLDGMQVRAVMGVVPGKGFNARGEPNKDQNAIKRVINSAQPPKSSTKVTSPTPGSAPKGSVAKPASEKKKAAFLA